MPGRPGLASTGFLVQCRAGGGVIYRASPKVCGACPRRVECCGSAKARTITRPDDSGLYDRTRANLRTPHARRSIRLRKCWAETAMAEAKERHGLRRAQCRGQPKVRIQALGVAMAYNVKKLAQHLGRRAAEPALALQAPQHCPQRCHGLAQQVRRRRRAPGYRRVRQQAPELRPVAHRNAVVWKRSR